MLALRYVLTLRRALKERSLVAFVAGIISTNFTAIITSDMSERCTGDIVQTYDNMSV